MKLFDIRERKKELKRKKRYDKYYIGDITTVSLKKNLKDKLQQILNSTDIFTNYNDMFVYFLFRLEERIRRMRP